MKTLLLLLSLGSCLFAEYHSQSFDGTWAVDMSAEQRSSDTGPFFDLFRLRQDKAGIHQEMHLVDPLQEGEKLSLFYPRSGVAAVANIAGRPVFTSSRREGESLSLLWRDSAKSEVLLRSVLTISPDGRTLTVSIFAHFNQSSPDQVVVLRRLDRTGKPQRPKRTARSLITAVVRFITLRRTHV
jgi:hypothetical protein